MSGCLLLWFRLGTKHPSILQSCSEDYELRVASVLLSLKEKEMKRSLASTSLLLFIISLALLWIFTLFESLLSGLSTGFERLISALILVVPASIGVVFGVLSLRRGEPKPWIAIAGILLNGAFALFNLVVLAFAG
jgi:hypothetical protein